MLLFSVHLYNDLIMQYEQMCVFYFNYLTNTFRPEMYRYLNALRSAISSCDYGQRENLNVVYITSVAWVTTYEIYIMIYKSFLTAFAQCRRYLLQSYSDVMWRSSNYYVQAHTSTTHVPNTQHSSTNMINIINRYFAQLKNKKKNKKNDVKWCKND